MTPPLSMVATPLGGEVSLLGEHHVPILYIPTSRLVKKFSTIFCANLAVVLQIFPGRPLFALCWCPWSNKYLFVFYYYGMTSPLTLPVDILPLPPPFGSHSTHTCFNDLINFRMCISFCLYLGIGAVGYCNTLQVLVFFVSWAHNMILKVRHKSHWHRPNEIF